MKSEQPQTIYLKDYRPPSHLIDRVELDVSLSPGRTRVMSRLAIRPNPAAKKASAGLKLDGEKLTLLGVSLNGTSLAPKDYDLTETALILKRTPAGPFSLEIATECDPEANKALTGLYRSRGIYCTQCEAEGFRRITYFLDRPDVLSRYSVRIEADKRDAPVLLSNGNLLEAGDLPEGRHFARWEDPHPKPSYLFALVGGNLGVIEDEFTTASGRRVALRIYVEPGKESDCRWAMECLKRAMRWDEERFGLEYDLDTFMIVAVSDFNMGAMENKGLNVFNDKLILANPETATDEDYEHIEAVVSNEYFHNWTGNRVTCRDWFQLCLKEGLTVFRDQEFTGDVRSAAVKRIEDVRFLKARQFQEDAGPLAHPVRPASFIEINNFYTLTVYEKGAEICRMLQTILGREGFRKGLDLYFRRHDGQAVTVEDFVAAMADANSADLGQFMLWYSQAGTPELKLRLTHSRRDRTVRLSAEQVLSPSPGQERKKPQHIPLKLGLIDANGEDLPLKVNGMPLKDGLLHIRKRKQSVVFEDIGEKPVPSLLRDFSAPVKLEVNLADRDLMFLMRHDTNLFNRWQSCQMLAMRLLKKAVAAVRAGEPVRVPASFTDALRLSLRDEGLDAAYRATLLGLPGERDIALSIGRDVDPEAVHAARTAFRARLGKALMGDLAETYERHVGTGPYSPDAASAGKRSLRNAALSLMAASGARGALKRVSDHFNSARNMTDCIAALAILATVDLPAREKAFDSFHKRWKHNALVMDKCFSLQAGSPLPSTLDRIAALSAHPLFSMSNPNKVRALYGAFAHGNQARFNDASGRGYHIVADAVMAIDAFNPQIAARLAGAFETWRIFDAKRQQEARRALESIAAKDGLSRDTYEIVTKILA
jgi:aminopeptidase N